MNGIDWLHQLVEKGEAVLLGGNGYPVSYAVKAGAVAQLLRHGLPKHGGAPVVGDDYFLPTGWAGNSEVKLDMIEAIDPNEQLIVEAWDQS